MTIRYGLIGCGMMGQEHLRNVALLDDVEVAMIYEPDAGMAAEAAPLCPHAEFASSFQEALKTATTAQLDALIVASPNHCHVDQLEAIVGQAGLPTLIEKPLYTTPDDLIRIEALQACSHAPIWVAMEYRYMPPLQAFIHRAREVTGDIKMLTITEHRFPFLHKVGNWNRFNRNSGGTFVEKCCHFFDLMRLILQSDPIRIMASGGQEVNHLDERYDGLQPDIWDCGYVIAEFANGARAMLELCMFAEGSDYQEMIHALGPSGKIEVKLPGPKRLWSGTAGAQPDPKIIESSRAACAPKYYSCPIDDNLLDAGDHNGATYYQHCKFLDVVCGQGHVEVGLNDGIWAVRMGLAAQDSALSGVAIQI